jgi:hypothetical protein
VHRLRIFSGFAVALMLCAVVMASPPLEWTAAHAQQFAAAKKRVERKGPEPKAAPQEQRERATFTAQDEDVAVIPGIPDARIWGVRHECVPSRNTSPAMDSIAQSSFTVPTRVPSGSASTR